MVSPKTEQNLESIGPTHVGIEGVADGIADGISRRCGRKVCARGGSADRDGVVSWCVCRRAQGGLLRGGALGDSIGDVVDVVGEP